MSLFVRDFLNSRISEIAETLQESNSEYALSVEKVKTLYETVDPILKSKTDITITPQDCGNFQELLNNDFTATAIMQYELYRQGYTDCVKLLKQLGAL